MAEDQPSHRPATARPPTNHSYIRMSRQSRTPHLPVSGSAAGCATPVALRVTKHRYLHYALCLLLQAVRHGMLPAHSVTHHHLPWPAPACLPHLVMKPTAKAAKLSLVLVSWLRDGGKNTSPNTVPEQAAYRAKS